MVVKLVMFLPDGRRKDLPVNHDPMVIGRGDKCGLRIPLLSVSRKHCELKVADENTLRIKDLGSSNGTFVNNKRITEAQLAAGDRLAVGPIVFTIQINGMPEEIQPVTTRGEKLAGSSLHGQKSGSFAGAAAAKIDEEGTIESDRTETVDESVLEQMVADALRDEEEGQI